MTLRDLLASWKAGRRKIHIPALAWLGRPVLTGPIIALLLGVAIVATLTATLSPGSAAAQTPSLTAAISDDTDGTPCAGDVASDAQCDLEITVTNHTSSAQQFTISETGVNGAFDDSPITPGTNTIGDCPCTYTVPADTPQRYQLQIRPGDWTVGYYTSHIRIHVGSGTGGAKLAEHRLELVIPPQPTTVTLGEVTETAIALSWTTDKTATSSKLSWWSKEQLSFSQLTTVGTSYTITGLEPSTAYVLRVQPVRVGLVYETAQFEVTTADPPARIDPCATAAGGDYDVDDDGLIEVSCLARLDAVRWDLDGDGSVDVYPPDKNGRTGHDPDGATKYAAAYPNAAPSMGCSSGGCKGYELTADLDFDTNGNGQADVGDDYWNEGKGWVPLMGGEGIYSYNDNNRFVDQVGRDSLGARPNPRARMFTGVFEGNGRTIANLYVNDAGRWHVGLFGYVGPGGEVRNFGLTAPNPDSGVVGWENVGSVAGTVEGGRVSAVYSEVDVSGDDDVGGLVGVVFRYGFVIESYATGDVSAVSFVGGLVGILNYSGAAASYATGDVTMTSGWAGGGLAGLRPDGHLRATYATGSVTTSEGTEAYADAHVGGLLGMYWHADSSPAMRANYAAGQVSAPSRVDAGGLVGFCPKGERLTQNYWDITATGQTTSGCGQGYTTAQLQAPTGYTGIYANWNVDVNVGSYYGEFDGPGDDPWDFGTSSQYPALKYCAPKPGIDTADGQPWCPLQPDNQRPAGGDTPLGDPTPEVSVTGGGGVTEGGTAQFTVTASPPAAADLSVSVTVSASGDYGVATSQQTVTIPTTGSATLTVSTSDDTTDEPDGSVTATLNAGAGYTVSSSQGAATVTVSDDDDAPAATCVTTDSALLAQVEPKTLDPWQGARPDLLEMFTRSYNTMQGNDDYTTADIRARPDKQGAEWQANGPGALWPLVYAELDRLETCRAQSSGDDPGPDNDPQQQQDPPPPTPEVSIAGGNGVTEGGDAQFTITASPAPGAPLAVTVSVAASGDYGVTTGARTVTIPTSGSATFTVPTTGDGADEADGSVTVTVNDGTGYDVSATAGAATVAVADDDVPEISVTGGAGVTEGGAASFTLTSSPAPASGLDVSVTVSQSGDYGVTTGARSVTIPTTGSATLTVATSDDAADEADGSVTATVKAGIGYTVSASQGAATVQVSDDDDPPPQAPEISIAGGNGVTEGGTASFTITADPAPASPITVNVGVSEDGDFGASGAATVTVSGATTTYTVSTSDDAVDEADGSVTATLKAGAGYTVSASAGAATVAVSDDDPTPEVSISGGSRVTEGGDATFTVTASPAPGAALDVSVTVSASGDYGVTTGTQTVTIPTSGSATFTVSTTDDGVDEADGSVTATLKAGAGYTVSASQGTATVAVSDDDDPPPGNSGTLTVSIANAREIAHRGEFLRFQVSASEEAQQEVTVSYRVSDLDGLIPGMDYCILAADDPPDADFECRDIPVEDYNDYGGELRIAEGEDSGMIFIWIDRKAWVSNRALVVVTLTGVEGAKGITREFATGRARE